MAMSASASHANAATTELLGLSAQQRIRAIRSERWVSYPRAQKTLQILEQILDHPRTTRTPSIAIFGDSGMGKTMLMQKFCADHPSNVDAETERRRTPVLALQMTSRPGERRFYAQILDALGAPHNPGARVVDAERSALNLLRVAQIQILVIDEVHNILSGSYREQRTMLNMLRFISNDLKASLVCFGVMEAREAIQGDVQLARRFSSPSVERLDPTLTFAQAIAISGFVRQPPDAIIRMTHAKLPTDCQSLVRVKYLNNPADRVRRSSRGTAQRALF
jgi:Bacterial TniB protein